MGRACRGICATLDRALRAATGRPLPLDAAPIRFGSWIGGDRDGNPNVTPEVTRQACWLARWMAADLYLREIDALRERAVDRRVASAELRARARRRARAVPRRAARGARAARATRDVAAEQALPRRPERGDAPAGRRQRRAVRLSAVDLAEPLQLCYRSLVETGNRLIADGRLTDVLRRVAAFGLTLVRLDIRQDSARHTARARRDRPARRARRLRRVVRRRRGSAFLVARARRSGRAAVAAAIAAATTRSATCSTPSACRRAASPSRSAPTSSRWPQAPSDVLAVELLQRARLAQPLRVVPLFETRATTSRAAGAMRRRAAGDPVVSRARSPAARR